MQVRSPLMLSHRAKVHRLVLLVTSRVLLLGPREQALALRELPVLTVRGLHVLDHHPSPTLAPSYSKEIATVGRVADWSFLTNHGRVMLVIAHDPGVRLRDIATTIGITERSAYGIVNDLTEAGYVVKERDGRRNRYIVQQHLPLPETTIRERTVGEVLDLLVGTKPSHRRAESSTKKTTRAPRSTKKR